MRTVSPALRLYAALLAAALISGGAQAAAMRVVSTAGNDANPCTVKKPCRTLQRGADATPAGGTLVVRDSGSFGNSLTIAKSITIAADGVAASLGGPGTVTINTNTVVTLRGLLLNGGNKGATGIHITNASAVHIERCTIERYAGAGIFHDQGNTDLFITDTVSRDNGGDGLFVNGSGTAVTVAIDNSRFENNGDDGIDIDTAESAVTRTLVARNGDKGIEQDSGSMDIAWSTAAHNADAGILVQDIGRMTLESSVSRGNGGDGLHVAFLSIAVISNNVMTRNARGITAFGDVNTRGNNTVTQNNAANQGNPLDPLAGI